MLSSSFLSRQPRSYPEPPKRATHLRKLNSWAAIGRVTIVWLHRFLHTLSNSPPHLTAPRTTKMPSSGSLPGFRRSYPELCEFLKQLISGNYSQINRTRGELLNIDIISACLYYTNSDSCWTTSQHKRTQAHSLSLKGPFQSLKIQWSLPRPHFAFDRSTWPPRAPWTTKMPPSGSAFCCIRELITLNLGSIHLRKLTTNWNL